MDQDVRWKQRYSNFMKALSSFEEFILKKNLSKLELQGLVKSFEYTYELAWNTLKDFLEHQGETNIVGPKDVIKRAFKVGIIANGQTWIDMIESRNRTSHIYNEEVAQEIAKAIVEKYYGAFSELKKKLATLIE